MDSSLAEDEWRVRLRQVVGDHGGPTMVAGLAGIPLQTLKNHLSGRTKKPPLRDLHRIATACGVDVPWLTAIVDSVPNGMEEGDVAPYEGPPAPAPLSLGVNRSRWVVRSRALELAGCLPGDLLEFDMTRAPKPGEPVVAQVCDTTGGAQTVLRIYRPPYLMVATADPAIDQTPIRIDAAQERVKPMGGFAALQRLAKD